MKIRIGFVSNSSSEAFICGQYNYRDIKKYTPEEVEDILRKMLQLYVEVMEMHNPDNYSKDYSFEHTFRDIRYITEQDVREMKDWDVEINRENIGKEVIFYSADDNSVPYGLFDLLERKFGTQRVHLG